MNNEIEKVWKDYWVPILFNGDAEGLDVEKLKEELYNYYLLGGTCETDDTAEPSRPCEALDAEPPRPTYATTWNTTWANN